MNDESTTSNENPYQSPSTGGHDASRSEIKYPSATRAILAGAWRGAKFGAKWMTLILAIPFVILFVVACGMLVNLMSKHGWDADLVISWLGLIGTQLLSFAYVVTSAVLASAIGMGMGGGLSYWRSRRKTESSTAS